MMLIEGLKKHFLVIIEDCGTNDKKYDAYIHLLKNALFLQMLLFLLMLFNDFTENFIIGGLSVIFTISFILYSIPLFLLNIWLLYKSKVLSYIFRMLIILLATFLVNTFFLAGISSSNSGLHIGSDSTRAMGTIVLFLMLYLFILLPLAIWGNRKRITFLKQNFRFLGYFLIPFTLFILILICGLIVKISVLSGNRSLPSSFSQIIVLLPLISFFVFNPILYFLIILYLEKQKGTDFYNSIYLINVVPITFIFAIISWTSILFNHFLDVPDMATDTNFNEFSSDDFTYITNDIATTETGLENSDVSTTNISEPIIAPISIDNVFNFGDVAVHTSIDVPQLQENPYILFAANHGTDAAFQIADASGMPQITIDNGIMYNSEHVPIANIKYDSIHHTISTLDMQGNSILTVDQHQQMWSGDGRYIGHVQHSGSTDVVRDLHEGIVCRKDPLTGTVFGPNGEILAQTKIV